MWVSARQARFLDAPDAVEYLKRVKQHFAANPVALASLLRQVRSWIETESTNPLFEQSAIAIASILRTNPPLLHGFNSLLKKGYRIEFSNKVDVVDLFVWVTPEEATICSFSGSKVPSPGSARELQDILSLDHNGADLLKLNSGNYGEEYLTCVSQLLQVIMDDSTTSSRCRRKAFRLLKELAINRSILPPSLFLNNLKREGSHGVQHAVGGGAFADIYKDRIQGTVFCFRVLRMFVTADALGEREKLYKEFCSEVLVWRQLKHPNILPFMGASTELFSPRFCFISLWMDRGDIMSYLKQNPRHDRFAAVCQIVDGIEYLHGLDPPVTHKDIKGANVLVTDEGICCLADFGLSSIFDSQRVDKSPGLQGSICWLAPELMEPTRSSVQGAKAGDIYALACTIYEIYTGKPPLSNLPNSAAVMLKVLVQQKRAQLPPEGTWTYEEEQLWVLVRQSWAQNPEDRYEIRKIKNFLKDLVCDKTPGAQGVSVTPSPETDSASEAARDLDKVRTWLDEELTRRLPSFVGRTTPPRPTRSPADGQIDSGHRRQYANEDASPYDTPASDLGGRSTLALGKSAKKALESRASPPAPLELSTIRSPQGLVTPNTPSSTQILPILESPNNDNRNIHPSNTFHGLATYVRSPTASAKTQSHFPPTPPRTPVQASSVQASSVQASPAPGPSSTLDTIPTSSTLSNRKQPSSSSVTGKYKSLRPRKFLVDRLALDGSEPPLHRSVSPSGRRPNPYAPTYSTKAKRPVGTRPMPPSRLGNLQSTSSAISPSPLRRTFIGPPSEDKLSP